MDILKHLSEHGFHPIITQKVIGINRNSKISTLKNNNIKPYRDVIGIQNYTMLDSHSRGKRAVFKRFGYKQRLVSRRISQKRNVMNIG
jgi:hypothetical protein